MMVIGPEIWHTVPIIQNGMLRTATQVLSAQRTDSLSGVFLNPGRFDRGNGVQD